MPEHDEYEETVALEHQEMCAETARAEVTRLRGLLSIARERLQVVASLGCVLPAGVAQDLLSAYTRSDPDASPEDA